MTNDPETTGQHPVEYGAIVNDGSDGLPIEIENPVPLRKKMSVGEKTRRAQALKLAGASYAAIAQQLGYSDASAARKAVMRGMKSALQENATELRRIHYGRLEHMLMLVWGDVNTRDLPSMNAALAIMDRMERLYGLNAAERLEVSGGSDTVILADGDKAAYLAALEEAGKKLSVRSAPVGDDDEEDAIDVDSEEVAETDD